MKTDPTPSPARTRTLDPLPYHWAMRAYLQKEEPALWQWFSSQKVRAEHADAARLHLLKSTYRIEADTQPRLYESAGEVLDQLGLQVPVTFYQARSDGGLNAALAFLSGEAHIILVGSVLTTLSPLEIKSMLGHELAHFLLYDGWNGELLVVSDILRALSNDASAHPCHRASARLFGLYSEVFADRGALAVTDDALVTIATLVKLETGLTEVSAESYLRQADEIFSKSSVKADQLTHPEPFIRARALRLFAEQGEGAGPDIERLIEGSPALDQLDLLGQQKVAETTRRLLQHLLAPRWFQTEPVLAHARLFFPDFTPEGNANLQTTLGEEIKHADQALQDYYCYVLLDFVAVDRELDEVPLAAAMVLCEGLGLGQRFSQIAARELGMTRKRLGTLVRDAERLLERASATTTAP
jgi:Zn-dependent protease with chaperone function